LIRRFVGPWLDEESWQRLHQSIDVSLQDGIFVLRDVSLATRKLTALLEQPVRIRKATIDKLEIHLTLEEHQEEEQGQEQGSSSTAPTSGTTTTVSSLVWRAWKLGAGAHVPGAVSVVVRIVVEGICIEIEPTSEVLQEKHKPPEAVVEEPASSKGIFASYIEAVLASLRLSLEINGLEVKMYAPSEETDVQDWVSVRIQSLSYHDVKQTATTPTEERNYETIVQKAVDVQRISVLVGATKRETNTPSTMVALLDGNSRFRLRMIGYRSPEKGPESTVEKPSQIQHDTEVSLGQKFNVLLDESTVMGLRRIFQCYVTSFENAVVATPEIDEVVTTGLAFVASREPTEEDRKQAEEDMQTLDGILKQYNEARRLAERKQLKGGILIQDEEDATNMTYDAFFDANDQSIYRYSTVMSHCLGGTSDQSGVDFVHFKAQVFLNSGSLKLAFGTKKLEYILATFSDLNATASLSTKSSTISLSLLHLDIEESRIISEETSTRPRTEISRVLQFINTEDPVNSEEEQGELLMTSPCISVEIQSAENPRKSQIIVNVEPMQLSCHPATLSNLSLFAEAVTKPVGLSSDLNERSAESSAADDIQASFSISLSCPSIDLLLPLASEQRLHVLFERCGYVEKTSISPLCSASLGVHAESLQVTLDTRGDKNSEKVASVSCKHSIIYIIAPSLKKLRIPQSQVVDLLCLSESSSPLSLEICIEKHIAPGEANHAVREFPLAPTIASFKARQEDEDEENQIDRVLLSKMREMGMAAKRELRGNDPQREMLQNCQMCETSIVISIPHVFSDLTVDECSALVGAIVPLKQPAKQPVADRESNRGGDTVNISISVTVEHVSLGIHHRKGVAGYNSETYHSFVLKMRRFRIHTVLRSYGPRHLRCSMQELDFLESQDVAAGTVVKDSRSAEMRSTAVFQRIKCADKSARPILYRSHLFKPLSRDSPSILIDLLFQKDASSSNEVSTRQSLHCTVYDITYRHDDESDWIEKLKRMTARFASSEGNDSQNSKVESKESLTRVFLAIADCNVDYSTPLRFQNSARILLRLGDMRCSSNIVLPAPSIQAYNASVADLSLCLCNHRHPHNYENSCLIDSDMLFVEKDRRHTFHDAPSAVRNMNYRTMILLDTMDTIIAIANNVQNKKDIPKIYASLTLGELSVFGSKDSFWLLAQSVGEAVGEATAVTDDQINALKGKSDQEEEDEDTFFDSMADAEEGEVAPKQSAYVNALDSLKKQSALRPALGTKSSKSQKQQFMLDGYDWTTIDQAEPTAKGIADDEEQSARWYLHETRADQKDQPEISVRAGPGVSLSEELPGVLSHHVRIIPHHFPLRPDNDPLADGDMGATRYANTGSSPPVSTRVLIHDMKLKLRLFDGYDWPELLSPDALNKERKDSFLIDLPDPVIDEKISHGKGASSPVSEKAKLMADLLGGPSDVKEKDTFKDAPLAEEKGARLMQMAKCRRLARRTGKYFQVSASGVCLRNDSFQQSSNHRLASCLNLKVQDFFIAETISGNKPLKMVGEWFSDDEHPRDSRDGLLMMKMVTWTPQKKVNDEGEIANDECETVVKVLPLRCWLDQKAIRFATTFFRPDNSKEAKLPKGFHAVPPLKVRLFRFKPFRLKVDYKPEKVNHQALRDGQIVELINFSPLHGMVLTLQQVEVLDSIGFGEVVSVLTKSWIGDICSTQITKFLTNARPFEPITTIAGGVTDMVVLPWEAIQNGDSLRRSLRSGAKSFAKAITYETLTISSAIAEFMATTTAMGTGSRPMLPSRPEGTPRGMTDTAPHALESIARGFQEANYKLVIIPYREYQRNGTTGALKSVLKGIPVALAAPTSGAAEALSFALLGARNQFRPDIRKEEEVNQRGLRLE